MLLLFLALLTLASIGAADGADMLLALLPATTVLHSR
jgi:hypothetical protein